MAQALVRDLKACSEVVARLKDRARRQGRSLQAELKVILEQAARQNAVDASSRLSTAPPLHS